MGGPRPLRLVVAVRRAIPRVSRQKRAGRGPIDDVLIAPDGSDGRCPDVDSPEFLACLVVVVGADGEIPHREDEGRESGTDRSDKNTIEESNNSTPCERERVPREQYLVPSSHLNSLLAILSRLSFEPP